MNRKILLGGIAAAVVIAAIAAVNVSRNSNESVVNDVALANVEALAFEDGWSQFETFENNGGTGESWPCTSGGRGSTFCSVSVNVANVLTTTCTVSCISGYYACCNAMQNKCQCRNY